MKNKFKQAYIRFLMIIENIKNLELEDWCRIFFIFGILLIVVAKPFSYLSDKMSLIIYCIGLIFCIGTMYLSDKYVN